jgi:hypothetical protein
MANQIFIIKEVNESSYKSDNDFTVSIDVRDNNLKYSFGN